MPKLSHVVKERVQFFIIGFSINLLSDIRFVQNAHMQVIWVK